MANLLTLHDHCPKALHGQPSPAACRWMQRRPTFEIDPRKLRILVDSEISIAAHQVANRSDSPGKTANPDQGRTRCAR